MCDDPIIGDWAQIIQAQILEGCRNCGNNGKLRYSLNFWEFSVIKEERVMCNSFRKVVSKQVGEEIIWLGVLVTLIYHFLPAFPPL